MWFPQLKIMDLVEAESGKGVFYYINQSTPLEIGKSLDIEVLDTLLIAKYGQRDLSPMALSVVGEGKIDSIQMSILGKLLSVYVDKWNNLYSIYMEDISLDSYKMTTHEEEKEDSKDKQEVLAISKSKNTDNVSGYDSDTLVPNNESLGDGEDNSSMDVTKNKNRERDMTVSGNKDNRLDDRAKAISLLDQTYVDIILTDVANELGSLIY